MKWDKDSLERLFRTGKDLYRRFEKESAIWEAAQRAPVEEYGPKMEEFWGSWHRFLLEKFGIKTCWSEFKVPFGHRRGNWIFILDPAGILRLNRKKSLSLKIPKDIAEKLLVLG